MSFPTLSSLLFYHHVFLISGPLALFVGVFLIRAMRQRDGQRPPLSMLIGPPLAFYMGIYHTWNTAVQVRNALYFRALTTDMVTAMDIEPMQRSTLSSTPLNEKPSNTLVTDADAIDAGFAHLQHASAISRSTSPLVSGFRIRLVLREGSGDWPATGLYLSAYHHRSEGGADSPVMIVVPHVSPDITPSTHGGYYTSPDFLAWVSSHAK